MRYLGGKSRIAKTLAQIIAPRGPWLEPFCGGQSMSVALSAYGPGVSGDANAALIALYRAVRDGWQPPENVTEQEYAEARALPDSDPRKAFFGFCCSFGSKWFGGFARGEGRNYAREGRDALIIDAKKIREANVMLCNASFFDYAPQSCVEILYCDPPYAGTTGYATGAFDHDAFWQRCREWAAGGTRVFVSEYTAPHDAICMWEKTIASTVSIDKSSKPRTEKLFRVPAQ